MSILFFFFFFNDTATTEIYTLSLHDALPISLRPRPGYMSSRRAGARGSAGLGGAPRTGAEIGRGHVLNPVTSFSRMASFSFKKKKKKIIGKCIKRNDKCMTTHDSQNEIVRRV